ncbi:hypothetical protein NQ318_021084 [Aromia moschata]|uniref:Rab3 GTPase-activating protein non-catalytic subunit n=1 Tax=Aromia moschata TaxID=1265417 RepID=A0AAV8XUU1_9CUCU|nr:hypothetical protein NQ318_021084 [Aromia moschata]
MSCQIRLTANIQDVATIRRCLFPTDDQRGSDSWLQLCEISASPTGDIIVIANERKIVVLSSKWDPRSSLSEFIITYSGSIHEYDKVKSVLCLPIVGQSHSTHVGPEWTCIAVAFDSGFVRFYTESCELLFEEQFHYENITSLKCQSQHSPRPDISPDLHPEEIYVHYQSNICVINGINLFTHLRNSRELLDKAQGKGDISDIPQVHLNPRKWGFQDQAVIHDTAVVGLNLSSTFDHLLTASTCGGFDTKYRTVPPNNTLVLACGCKPFFGIPLCTRRRITASTHRCGQSCCKGWLTGSKPQIEKQTASFAMQPAEVMGCRFGLCDLRRTATSIILSPDHKLAAVSDALGRVLLIDAFRGVTLRIFKGYREAQCSFIQVPEERKSKHRIGNKVAHFLVIYSSKKGTLEVFSVQQGSRICTFTASKFSRLLYITHGLMGYTTTSKSKYVCQFTTVFVDNDGQLKEFLIPFHFALEEKNSKRARDIHLYKKIRQLVKSGEYDDEKLSKEVYNTCTELKTIEIKSQMVDMLLNNKDIPAEVSRQCMQYFVENLAEDDANNLKLICENASLILKFYIFVKSLSITEETNDDNGNLEKIENTTLNLDAKELKNLQRLLDLSTINNNKSNEVHVSFSDNAVFSSADFLSTFDLSKASNNIFLKENVDENILFKAAEVIFKPYIVNESVDYEILREEILKSKINIKNIFELLMNYWVNRPLYINLNLEKEMNNLSRTIYALVKTANKDMVTTEYSEISKFWSEIREILANSSRPFPSLMAAILCKCVAQKIETETQMSESSTSLDDENIEILTQENVQWSLLMGKLEDISLLNIILSSKPIVKDCSLPKLEHEKNNISLKYILTRGKGCVSELVAQWLTLAGLNPETIIVSEAIYKKNNEDDSTSLENKLVLPEGMRDEMLMGEPILKYLHLLKLQFPYSLEANSLLANMAWEYALAWQKDIQNLGNLEAAIKCTTFVENIQIKQGLYQLLWNTQLKIVNESACKLINKVGKLPKERLCRQATGLSDYQISLFIGISTEFLDSFIDVAQLSYDAPQNIWDNGGQPLVALAAQQKEVNYDLLHLHYQLSTVLQMITTFSVKHVKPVNNLFEASVVNLLFTDLQKKVQVNWTKSDIKINASRTQFLCKIISASLETVTVNREGNIYSMEHVKWMSKCVTLARFWNLEVDVIRRFQVTQLYLNGFDSFADELVPAINDLNELGKQLLEVAAKRLLQFLTSSPNLSENISALSPVLTQHFDSLDDKWCAPSRLKHITNLATQVLRCLDENQAERKLAQLLLESCSNLEEINS